MKSVGATNSFVRIPFIVEGVVIGLLSGLISATVLYFAYDKAVEVVYGIAPVLSLVNMHPYAGWLYLIYLVVGMLFGILGGAISIGRYLKREARTPLSKRGRRCIQSHRGTTCVGDALFRRLPHLCVDKRAVIYYNKTTTGRPARPHESKG